MKLAIFINLHYNKKKLDNNQMDFSNEKMKRNHSFYIKESGKDLFIYENTSIRFSRSKSYYKKNTIPFYISILKKYIIFFALDVKKIFALIANLNTLDIM